VWNLETKIIFWEHRKMSITEVIDVLVDRGHKVERGKKGLWILDGEVFTIQELFTLTKKGL